MLFDDAYVQNEFNNQQTLQKSCISACSLINGAEACTQVYLINGVHRTVSRGHNKSSTMGVGTYAYNSIASDCCSFCRAFLCLEKFEFIRFLASNIGITLVSCSL